MTGRPTKFTPVIREAILQAIRMGNTRASAAEATGIHRDTLHTWTERFPAFSDAIKEAEAYAEQEAVKAIVSQFHHQWTAAAWYLERKHPDEWGKKERVDVTSGGKPFSFTLQVAQAQDDVNSDSD